MSKEQQIKNILKDIQNADNDYLMDIDSEINTFLLPMRNLNLVKFKSLGPDTSDPLTTARVIDTLLRHGSLVPQDGRQEAEKLLGRDLPKVDKEWSKKPLKLTISETVSGRTFEAVSSGDIEIGAEETGKSNPLSKGVIEGELGELSEDLWKENN